MIFSGNPSLTPTPTPVPQPLDFVMSFKSHIGLQRALCNASHRPHGFGGRRCRCQCWPRGPQDRQRCYSLKAVCQSSSRIIPLLAILPLHTAPTVSMSAEPSFLSTSVILPILYISPRPRSLSVLLSRRNSSSFLASSLISSHALRCFAVPPQVRGAAGLLQGRLYHLFCPPGAAQHPPPRTSDPNPRRCLCCRSRD